MMSLRRQGERATSEDQPADPDRQARLNEIDALYEQYGKPLEREHWGEFLAIAPDGRTILGSDMAEVAHQAVDAFGKGIFLYKVGERVVGKIRGTPTH